MCVMAKKLTVAVIVFGTIAWLSGCATPPINVGTPPAVEMLSGLVVGTSTAQDVRNALGEPRGSGKVRHNTDVEARDIIYYEFIQLKGNQIGLKLLLVFLKDDVYDGHLWFGAQELIERQL
jgi:hypothetical protein